ncbi:LysR substrate-binding domain-containing protein [Enterovibrio sp. ZSDZ35]|uniref:LysR substrate-binding domain-containing protein n=1 Tax=Enterovibrio qingdaonensis TaxID=2899818 RepID=A0ABT5QIX6_9GAMM|nr:LysR substrate-binding domain-containing protein [Enterovibrio sp. ZSDZ35]MDD1780941.1 LysR substrate-binding domain-containing protein [Enterovibrio sp. ZSDZ35]
MKLPPLSALKAFEATARHLSFSLAAEELFVTHAAVSHQIKRLEEWFQMRLFERRGRGIRLTRSGELLFRRVSPALNEIAEACNSVKAMKGNDALTVGCIPSIANRWLVPHLVEFTAAKPNLDVKVVYASVADSLAANELDVLISTDEHNMPGVKSEKLFSRTKKPVCSPSFLEKHSPIDTPLDIARVPLIHDEQRKEWQHWFDSAGVCWSATDSWPVFQDFNLLATAVIAGHGVALCPVEVFRLEIARGDLIVLSDIATKQDLGYYASYRQNASTTVFDFVEWFRGVVVMDAEIA